MGYQHIWAPILHNKGTVYPLLWRMGIQTLTEKLSSLMASFLKCLSKLVVTLFQFPQVLVILSFILRAHHRFYHWYLKWYNKVLFPEIHLPCLLATSSGFFSSMNFWLHYPSKVVILAYYNVWGKSVIQSWLIDHYCGLNCGMPQMNTLNV